jgi:hypothetical protein
MIQHIWSVLCSRALLDKDSNNISLIEVIEQINVGAIPPGDQLAAIPMPMELVTLWCRAPEDPPTSGRARVVIIGVTGTRTELPPYNIDLATYPRVRNRSRFAGVQYQQLGRMEFVVELQVGDGDEWTPVAKLPVQVAPIASPQYN